MIENLSLLLNTILQTLEVYMNIENFSNMNKTSEIESVFNKLIILVHLTIEFVITQPQYDKILKDDWNGDEAIKLKASLLAHVFHLMQIHNKQVGNIILLGYPVVKLYL